MQVYFLDWLQDLDSTDESADRAIGEVINAAWAYLEFQSHASLGGVSTPSPGHRCLCWLRLGAASWKQIQPSLRLSRVVLLFPCPQKISLLLFRGSHFRVPGPLMLESTRSVPQLHFCLAGQHWGSLASLCRIDVSLAGSLTEQLGQYYPIWARLFVAAAVAMVRWLHPAVAVAKEAMGQCDLEATFR